MLANSKDPVEAAGELIKLLKRTATNGAFLEWVLQRTRATV